MVDPGRTAAARVGIEAMLLTRSSSSISGDNFSNEVDEDVEMSRLEVLLSALSCGKATHPSPRFNDHTRSTPSSPSIAATFSRPAPLRTTRREFAFEDPDAMTR
jgi:hypothetical protein